MAIVRLGVEDAKHFWFQNDLIIYTLTSNETDEVIALPKVEVERGLKYLHKLKSCKTYGDAQNLYTLFSKDLLAPKLIPRIEDITQHYDFLRDFSFSKKLPLTHDKNSLHHPDEDPTSDELMVNIENDEFVWNESAVYLDDNEQFAACRNIQIWTDAWIPLEIATTVGIPDLGYGIDYYEAEMVYKDRELFINEFLKFGISTKIDHPDLKELAGY